MHYFNKSHVFAQVLFSIKPCWK